MQYAAGENNFYALLATILNPKLTSNKALNYFGLCQVAEERLEPVEPVEAPPREVLKDLYYNKGLKQGEIAQMYGVGQHNVSRWFKSYHIPPKSYNWSQRSGKPCVKIYINDEEFDRMKAEGMNQKQIAKALNVSGPTISKYVKERFKRYE